MAKLPNGWLQLVRSLCREWFPIEYPQSWYEDITSSERFFALAAVYKSQIIGLIVAEIKPYLKLNAEDRGILSRWFASKDTLVAYILSLVGKINEEKEEKERQGEGGERERELV
ncbi:hypothetical protein MSG28_005123 [Choristoneura fumiferana]|uniref:Uncharacterized protein n=1 Tax=Choristoneura fumiferana TaxID=7141 RepID=A0ACC0JPZ3_CHOFU|nr:hypothetical protein MSG28_005123 [Choristoneura fumiferana]